MPPFELEEPSFRQIETGSEDQLMGAWRIYALCFRAGGYDLYGEAKTDVLLPEGNGPGYRLYHARLQ